MAAGLLDALVVAACSQGSGPGQPDLELGVKMEKNNYNQVLAQRRQEQKERATPSSEHLQDAPWIHSKQEARWKGSPAVVQPLLSTPAQHRHHLPTFPPPTPTWPKSQVSFSFKIYLFIGNAE